MNKKNVIRFGFLEDDLRKVSVELLILCDQMAEAHDLNVSKLEDLRVELHIFRNKLRSFGFDHMNITA